MESFICLNCNYNFKSKQSPKTCPYCNKNTVEKEKSAEDIISEIENL